MLDRIPQRDTEIIEQLAFNYAKSVHKAARNNLATMYKKGVIAERKALLDEVLHILDKWERTKDAVSNIRKEVIALRGGE